jgi:hypothetical protein
MSKRATRFVSTRLPPAFGISPWDEEFNAKMEVAERVIRRYRDAFKKLTE